MSELKDWLQKEHDTPPEKMADFFSSRIDIYDKVHLEHWSKEYEHIGEFFDGNIDTLLDIGCGTGLELNSIYRKYPKIKVTGIDLSEDMLNQLRAKYNNKDINLIADDYFEHSLKKEVYDVALSVQTLHHFKYEKKKKIYGKLFNTIKAGGYYIECDYMASCIEEEQLCLELYEYKHNKFNIPEDEFIHVDIPLTLEHQIELLKSAGFSDVSVLYENGGTKIIRANK
ncbi:methyltransferase type 11 [Enterococcus sp. CU9D]|nr:methyltransferase type 11 [Enterococcus sp. CU9D]